MSRTVTSSFSVLAAVGALAAIPAMANAQSFHFTYSDTAGLSAYGDIYTSADLGGGNFWALSGTLVIQNGALAGSYALIPGGPGYYTLTPSGLFGIDNVMYTGNTPTLDDAGLGFISAGQEINIWGNSGANDYTIMGAAGGSYNLDHRNVGTFVLTAVPAPGSLALVGLGGLAAFRRRRA